MSELTAKPNVTRLHSVSVLMSECVSENKARMNKQIHKVLKKEKQKKVVLVNEMYRMLAQSW